MIEREDKAKAAALFEAVVDADIAAGNVVRQRMPKDGEIVDVVILTRRHLAQALASWALFGFDTLADFEAAISRYIG